MRELTLRSRLLIGVGLVALVQVVAAYLVISSTSDQLLDQIDDRLEVAAEAVGASDTATVVGVQVTGTGDVYQGVLAPDGSLVTLNSVSLRSGVVPPPEVVPLAIERALEEPVTVEAESGQVEYRLLALDMGDGDTLLLASPLRGYEWTMNRLIRLIAIVAAMIVLLLAAVGWWVLRLGINPIKHMTSTAEAIAAGDLSERIEVTQSATEAGQLGLALNTMMGQIETSFEERRRAEDRLREFLADASHELRTPVATIRGYAELYEAGGLGHRDDLDDAMRRTRQESERMSRLVADMLSLAKLDREPIVQTRLVDLCAVASDVVADAVATHADRTFSVEMSTNRVMVAGDEDLLRQAVSNLVSNAVAHAGVAASVTVVVDDAGRPSLTVVDDGDGMPEDVARRATERFFRADPSRSRHKGGSGLGLAIVASIVAAHDGEFELKSSPGSGTTATISFAVNCSMDAAH